jgi:hypothetical protein
VIKFMWTNLVSNRLQGGAQSFEDWGEPKKVESESESGSMAA